MRKTLNYLTPLVLTYIFIIPLIRLLTDTFELSVSPFLILHLLVLSTLLWISRCFARPAVPAIIGCIAYLAILALLAADSIIAQTAQLLDRIIHAYSVRYFSFTLALSGGESADDVSFAMTVLGFLACAVVMGTLTASSARISATILASVPLFTLAICVNGHPAVWQIALLLIFWVLVFATGPSFMPEQDSAGMAFFVLLIPAALLICLVLALVDPSGYDYDREPNGLALKLQGLEEKLAARLDGGEAVPDGSTERSRTELSYGSAELSFTPGELWGADDGTLDLSTAYPNIDADKVILRVTAETSGCLYLRSLSYGDYCAAGWERAEEVGTSSLDFTAKAIGSSGAGIRRTARIELRSASRSIAHLPYYTDAGGNDSSVEYPGSDTYSVDYLTYPGDITALTLPDDIAQRELEYRQYAHDVYTRLPESTKADLLSIAAANGISSDGDGTVGQLASFVRSRVTYSIDTAPYPTDDCAVYFFTDAETGYCIHYATAACAMYRALGIPARVVDGFLAVTEAGRRCDVTASQEHAWVEVYYDGLGWIPVEVTGSYGEVGAPVSGQNADAALSASPASPLPEHEPTPSQAPAVSVGIIGTEPQTGAPVSAGAGILLAVIPAVILLSAALFLVLRHYADIAMRRRSFSQRDRRKAAIAVWKYAKRLEAYGGEMPEFISLNAEKAFYSQHDISPVEMRCALELVSAMAQETYERLDKKHKFKFKYIQGLI